MLLYIIFISHVRIDYSDMAFFICIWIISLYVKDYQKEYNNQLCFYNGETLTLRALLERFKSQGIDHPTQEAKKYLL